MRQKCGVWLPLSIVASGARSVTDCDSFLCFGHFLPSNQQHSGLVCGFCVSPASQGANVIHNNKKKRKTPRQNRLAVLI